MSGNLKHERQDPDETPIAYWLDRLEEADGDVTIPEDEVDEFADLLQQLLDIELRLDNFEDTLEAIDDRTLPAIATDTDGKAQLPPKYARSRVKLAVLEAEKIPWGKEYAPTTLGTIQKQMHEQA